MNQKKENDILGQDPAQAMLNEMTKYLKEKNKLDIEYESLLREALGILDKAKVRKMAKADNEAVRKVRQDLIKGE